MKGRMRARKEERTRNRDEEKIMNFPLFKQIYIRRMKESEKREWTDGRKIERK